MGFIINAEVFIFKSSYLLLDFILQFKVNLLYFAIMDRMSCNCKVVFFSFKIKFLGLGIKTNSSYCTLVADMEKT